MGGEGKSPGASVSESPKPTGLLCRASPGRGRATGRRQFRFRWGREVHGPDLGHQFDLDRLDLHLHGSRRGRRGRRAVLQLLLEDGVLKLEPVVTRIVSDIVLLV